MFRRVLRTTIFSTAIVLGGPALAGPGGGHGGGGGGMGPAIDMHSNGPTMNMPGNASPRVNSTIGVGARGSGTAGVNARVSSRAVISASPRAMTRANVRSSVRTGTVAKLSSRAANSQALMHASPTAIANANSHSVLARNSVATTALPGLATGLTVKGRGGATVGTVSQIVTGRTDGRIRLVLATTASGRTLRLPPTALSISGGVVTTTSM